MSERHMMRIVVELVTGMTTDEVESEISLLVDNLWADIYDIDVEDMGVEL